MKGATTVSVSQAVRDFNWLINGFTERVAGVSHAVVVSSDGMLVPSPITSPRQRRPTRGGDLRPGSGLEPPGSRR
jgi:hypothetical protein